MEITYKSFALLACALLLSIWAWSVLNWVWLRPKKLERCLRKQGLKGNSYRLLYGDLKENSMMIKEVKSRPINLSDDILPRIMPFSHKSTVIHGKNSFMWAGPSPRVYIMDPELVKEVLSKNFNYKKPRVNPLIKFLSNGLPNHDDELWAKHRKIINPAFHLEKLKHMLPAFYLSCCEMISKWESLVSAEGSRELDVWPCLQALTSDVISRTAFGSNYEEGRRIFQLQAEQSVLTVQAISSVYIPGWSVKEVLSKNFNYKKPRVNPLIKFLSNGLPNHDDELWAKHRKIINPAFHLEKLKHMLPAFYLSCCEMISKWESLVSAEGSRELDVWPCLQALTSDVISRTAFGSNYEEGRRIFQLQAEQSVLTVQAISSVYILSRTIYEDTKLGGLSLPTGVLVCLPIIRLHHDRDIWGDDVKEFNPERFSEGLSKATKTQVSFFPFSWGPRVCIGQNFAMLEAKMAVAMILKHFSFELSPSYTHAPFTVVTLRPQHGAHLILKKL
ncbi:Cytochrome P450 CYP72A219 like [Actinidia chinensis var. chinensis]|uniref:Cytochrome P450 CYP72A219 like n=1 Tax=Actinidia chinensis var. chinensis TaxID=1590841 RepID=A0A2R6PYM4_ACTCC|nr:Cytochrome P450 CYP72A219 like [Actinidia chinensis var. chinensis]